MSGQTILVVEDEQSLREVIRDKLAQNNYVVLEAADGEEGLQIALAKQPDLVLLDIIMPKMNGIDMLRALREDNRGKAIKTILLTNLTDVEKMNQTLMLGSQDYIIKSDIKLDDLLKLIQDRLGQQKPK